MWTYLGDPSLASHTDRHLGGPCSAGRVPTLCVGGNILIQCPLLVPVALGRAHSCSDDSDAVDYKLWSPGYRSRTGVSLKATSWGGWSHHLTTSFPESHLHLLESSCCHIPSTSSRTSHLFWEAARAMLACRRGQVELFLLHKTENRNLVSTVSCFSCSLQNWGKGKEVGDRPFKGVRDRKC